MRDSNPRGLTRCHSRETVRISAAPMSFCHNSKNKRGHGGLVGLRHSNILTISG